MKEMPQVPCGESKRLLYYCFILALGMIGEFELWFSAAQATDVFYILSDGGKASQADWAKEQMGKLRRFVNVCDFSGEDIDGALASTWRDFEDACVNQVAHKVKPDAVITGNVKDFALSDFPVFDCDGLFERIRSEEGVSYCEIAFEGDTETVLTSPARHPATR